VQRDPGTSEMQHSQIVVDPLSAADLQASETARQAARWLHNAAPCSVGRQQIVGAYLSASRPHVRRLTPNQHHVADSVVTQACVQAEVPRYLLCRLGVNGDGSILRRSRTMAVCTTHRRVAAPLPSVRRSRFVLAFPWSAALAPVPPFPNGAFTMGSSTVGRSRAALTFSSYPMSPARRIPPNMRGSHFRCRWSRIMRGHLPVRRSLRALPRASQAQTGRHRRPVVHGAPNRFVVRLTRARTGDSVPTKRCGFDVQDQHPKTARLPCTPICHRMP